MFLKVSEYLILHFGIRHALFGIPGSLTIHHYVLLPGLPVTTA